MSRQQKYSANLDISNRILLDPKPILSIKKNISLWIQNHNRISNPSLLCQCCAFCAIMKSHQDKLSSTIKDLEVESYDSKTGSGAAVCNDLADEGGVGVEVLVEGQMAEGREGRFVVEGGEWMLRLRLVAVVLRREVWFCGLMVVVLGIEVWMCGLVVVVSKKDDWRCGLPGAGTGIGVFFEYVAIC